MVTLLTFGLVWVYCGKWLARLRAVIWYSVLHDYGHMGRAYT